jgi:site-specific DNA-cytosine methylase
VNVFGADVIEMDPDCEPTLRALWGDNANIHIGDMLTIKFEDLHDADGFVAGLPCPITSSLGQQGGTSDPRSETFLRGIEMMHELGKRHGGRKFKWFILGHVNGSLCKVGGATTSFADMVMTKIQSALPHFEYFLWRENCINHASPQSRPCIFFCRSASYVPGGSIWRCAAQASQCQAA